MVIEPDLDQILYANPQACRLLGYSLKELLQTPLSTLNGREMPKLLELRKELPRGAPLIRRSSFHTKFGTTLQGEIAISSARLDGGTRLIASIRDIGARIDETNQLVHEAMHDHLTGLPNRALFEDRFSGALNRRRRSACGVAIILFDLDGFKAVNDTFGHEAGDDMLRATAGALRNVLRPTDTAARFGGDEFIVLCEGIDDERAVLQVGRRIAEATKMPGDRLPPISISMGIAIASEESTTGAQLISNADAALYRAKKSGRARHELFDEGMRARAQQRLKDEIALQHAVERHELKLVFQPQIDLSTGHIAGGEALLRWQHPERGMVVPSEFVPLAEETNLIKPIGSWVLREACGAAQRWRIARPRRHPLSIAVNVSAKQLGHSDLVDEVAQVLEETGTDPRTLCLEITESALGADSPSCLETLFGLRDLGVCLVMDDFGKGFSSLSYLRTLPVEILKIDQSFVLGASEPNDQALLQAAVDMAHALGLTVIAEGVENVHQLKKVLISGADLAQGYFFGMPREALITV